MDGQSKYFVIFHKLLKRYKHSFAQLLEELSLTPCEADILMLLGAEPACDTATEICARFGISRALVCRSVETLLARGYLHAAHDRADRRLIRLSLCDAALPAARALRQYAAEYYSRLFYGVDPQDFEVFKRVLLRMAENVAVPEDGALQEDWMEKERLHI